MSYDTKQCHNTKHYYCIERHKTIYIYIINNMNHKKSITDISSTTCKLTLGKLIYPQVKVKCILIIG